MVEDRQDTAAHKGFTVVNSRYDSAQTFSRMDIMGHHSEIVWGNTEMWKWSIDRGQVGLVSFVTLFASQV